MSLGLEEWHRDEDWARHFIEAAGLMEEWTRENVLDYRSSLYHSREDAQANIDCERALYENVKRSWPASRLVGSWVRDGGDQ